MGVERRAAVVPSISRSFEALCGVDEEIKGKVGRYLSCYLILVDDHRYSFTSRGLKVSSLWW